MEKDHFRTLQLLIEIESDVKVTQRSLSKKLGIALGLTNAYLKRLINKGFVKIHRASANDIRYVLTPSGLMEKTRLTYEYLQYSLTFYRDVRSEVQRCFKSLEQKRIKYLAFYGAGEVAEIAYICLHGMSLEIVGVIDDHKAGGSFFGHPIQERSFLGDLEFDAIFLASFEHASQMRKNLLEMGIPKEKIVQLGELSHE
jgi:DNA-binding MarR family transcriptional regulator